MELVGKPIGITVSSASTVFSAGRCTALEGPVETLGMGRAAFIDGGDPGATRLWAAVVDICGRGGPGKTPAICAATSIFLGFGAIGGGSNR